MANYHDDAQREIEREKIFRDWITARVDTIHHNVSAYDILTRYGVKLRYGGGRPEQMFCPFHGNTRTPAARYHPKDMRSPDHVWCFVCNQRWDCIGLFRNFENRTGDKFSVVLRALERQYGIVPPESPPLVEHEPEDHERIEVEERFSLAEFRLKEAREAFDMRGYLILGSILDRLRWQFENGKMLSPSVIATLKKVVEKIGEKERPHVTPIEGLDS